MAKRQTDPEHIDFVVSELRSCHERLFLAPDDRPAEVSTYSLAADLIEELAAEVEALRSVVFEACDVALVTVSDEPAYFAAFDSYEDEIESARFTPAQQAAVRRALEGRG